MVFVFEDLVSYWTNLPPVSGSDITLLLSAKKYKHPSKKHHERDLAPLHDYLSWYTPVTSVKRAPFDVEHCPNGTFLQKDPGGGRVYALFPRVKEGVLLMDHLTFSHNKQFDTVYAHLTEYTPHDETSGRIRPHPDFGH